MFKILQYKAVYFMGILLLIVYASCGSDEEQIAESYSNLAAMYKRQCMLDSTVMFYEKSLAYTKQAQKKERHSYYLAFFALGLLLVLASTSATYLQIKEGKRIRQTNLMLKNLKKARGKPLNLRYSRRLWK